MIMTPKEKAIELVNKMVNKAYEVDCFGGEYMIAKRCALIAVYEIIEALDINKWQNKNMINYFKEVKHEIEKL